MFPYNLDDFPPKRVIQPQPPLSKPVLQYTYMGVVARRIMAKGTWARYKVKKNTQDELRTRSFRATDRQMDEVKELAKFGLSPFIRVALRNEVIRQRGEAGDDLEFKDDYSRLLKKHIELVKSLRNPPVGLFKRMKYLKKLEQHNLNSKVIDSLKRKLKYLEEGF